MKNFVKLFVAALIVALVASLFVMSSQAASFVDPSALKPASDRVVFIMDPDENGNLPGDGSGDDADNPLAVVDHESFDPDAENPRNYFQTAFYQATELIRKTGGTIVICGPIYLGIDQAYGHGDTTRDGYRSP